jgi:hypothetical protein
MNIAEAFIEFAKTEILPGLAGGSDFTAAVLNGALRAGKKRIAEKFNDAEIFKAFGVVDQNGSADVEAVADFFDGAFEGREKISLSLAELLKMATGVDSSSELLAGKVHFTKNDAEKFLELLRK